MDTMAIVGHTLAYIVVTMFSAVKGEPVRPSLTLLTALITGCGSVGLDVMDTGGMASTLAVDPAGQIDFGSHSTDATKSIRKDVVLSVHGDQPIAVVDVYIDDTSDPSFWMSPNIPVPIRLQPDSVFPIEIRFQPDDQGPQRGELVILIDDGTVEGAYLRRPIVGEGL